MFRDWYESLIIQGLRKVELEREMWQWGISEFRTDLLIGYIIWYALRHWGWNTVD